MVLELRASLFPVLFHGLQVLDSHQETHYLPAVLRYFIIPVVDPRTVPTKTTLYIRSPSWTCATMIVLRFLFLSLATAFYVTACALFYSHKPTVYIIRHAERSPEPHNHGLGAEGNKRAQCLRDIFGDHSPYNIGHIMAPKINSRMLAQSTNYLK